ncbi:MULTISPECIES: type 4a pilus biogenesis protein PilO [Thauera]|jgi:type IV pilus assembly protein PilO|uniref:Tfp pilus assembly protein PilO n=2 Tax=Thauera aminoaromatica TaxID=164330 RepID=N6Y289_THASP|nr:MULTISPECIES: type 4a pilus biogenesis protein PilO [Thauera]MDA0236217.1 type 4a pilus biogenesis protein PilO [Pseudomonadota bacterium]OPZ01251.1 MAG: Pilus assembly protein, PilO [Alphaproteobacteria bacterium ADurb.BinA305]ENO88296.1 Tfp pilus assembly protein PilO [Thauera aminoaromatica S2]KIN90066.1 pilus assembly, PilO family protein [Thauera sp. SWB20]MBL8463162.1 type 4a pilus biogenesis protein PilO [Thauera sp.]
MSFDLGALRDGIDFRRLAEDFRGLDPQDPGMWPAAPRVVVAVCLLLLTVAGFWWFDWQGQVETLEARQTEEVQLRESWVTKKRQAVNLEEHRRQLAEIDRQFGALLKQLPNRAEMDSLLSDINQAGLGRGLQFELFKPGADVIKEFYAEMPIDVRVTGVYHDLGEFVADLASMPRVVTLGDVGIEADKDGRLKLQAKAVTYRYLDEEELAQQRKAAQAAKQGNK